MTKSLRQILLDLLSEYQALEKPANPDLLKIFIDNSEAAIIEWAKGIIGSDDLINMNGMQGRNQLRKEQKEKLL
jgi:hypothetical protein